MLKMAAPMSRAYFSQIFPKLGFRICKHGEICPVMLQSQRYKHSKHYNPKFKKERAAKFMEIELPEYDTKKSTKEKKKSLDEQRMENKKKGNEPPNQFNPKPISITSTSGVFESYIPPEGDGRLSKLSKDGARQSVAEVGMKTKSLNEVRKIKKYEDFSSKTFPAEATEIYIETHKLLEDVKKNEDRLHDLVTEFVFPRMTNGLETKTLRWDFVKSIEAPRVVHVRTTDMMSKDNLYAQVTVRFHTKQILAIYDRFGRLMYGSENLAKDVLEYVVFEKHISDEYGQWRIHSKIHPKWAPPSEPLHKTYIKQTFDRIVIEEDEDGKSEEKTDDKEPPPPNQPSQSSPELATA